MIGMGVLRHILYVHPQYSHVPTHGEADIRSQSGAGWNLARYLRVNDDEQLCVVSHEVRPYILLLRPGKFVCCNT